MGKLTVFKCSTLSSYTPVTVFFFFGGDVSIFKNNNFSVRLLLVLRGHSVFSSPPQCPMTSDFEEFLSQMLSIKFLSYHNSSERASNFSF